MQKSAAALLIAASLVAHAPAQTPQASARIRGRVVAAATGRPLSRATVRIGAVGNPEVRRTVMTDSNGRYEIPDLPAGRYSFSASHVGYLDQQFDQPLPLSRYRLLELAAGEQLDGIDFSLHRGGAVVGIINDEFGEPLPDVRVEVMREVYGIAGRSFIPELRMSEPSITDDEGRYRVYGLPPGAYIVAGIAEAPATESESSGYAKTYYPGTTNEAGAQIVRVGLGEDAAADFAMAPARLSSRVSGIVRDSEGRSASGIRITLTTSRGAYFETIGQTGAENDGSFRFDHVRPGQHLIHVRPRGGEPRLLPRVGEWAAVRVNVTGEDISDLVITTSNGFSIRPRRL